MTCMARMSERMNAWANGCMNARMDGCMKERDYWANERMDEFIDETK